MVTTERKPKNPILFILIVYFIAFALRAVEYMLIRTDKSMFGEAFLHKLAGILLLGIAIRYLSLRWREVGFAGRSALKYACCGLFLGAAVFAVAYGVEALMQWSAGNRPSLQVYVTSYAVGGNQRMEAGFQFFAFCIIGNLINVLMEEGVFRGLFMKLGQQKYSFVKAAALSSVLFGLWHIAAPLRSLLDGEISPAGAIMSALMLILTAGITGFKFCLLTKMTGSLWMAMADHFVNNTVVNILHVATQSGADEMQVVRIAVAQALSFLIVLFLYWKTGAHRKHTFRPYLTVENMKVGDNV